MKNDLRAGICFLAFSLIVSLTGLKAQVNDAGLWTNLSLEKKITKDLDLLFTEEFRFNENLTELGSFFSDIGAEYKIYKGLKAGLFYRYTNKRRVDDSYSQAHRIYADVAYKHKIKRFEIGYRVRFQVQYKDVRSGETGPLPEWYMRQKLHLSYNTRSRFDPYLDGEIWYLFSPEWSRFDNYRLSAGIVTRITKNHSLDLGYIFQKEFNINSPETDYILFLGYKISF